MLLNYDNSFGVHFLNYYCIIVYKYGTISKFNCYLFNLILNHGSKHKADNFNSNLLLLKNYNH